MSPEPTRRISAVTEDSLPGSSRRTVATDTVVLRGEDAARAQRIDLVGLGAGVAGGAGPGMGTLGHIDGYPDPEIDMSVLATGPWADELIAAREQARTLGHAEGYDRGLAEGLEAGREQARAEVAALEERYDRELGELGHVVRTMLDGLDEQSRQLSDQIVDRVVDLALEVAEAVIGREVRTATDPGAEAIARCLDLVPVTASLVVRLHPDDAAGLGTIPELSERDLVIAADPSLERGDAIVTADQVTIDARLGAALERVAEALR